jgi:outer membrane protein assembly factor BamB
MLKNKIMKTQLLQLSLLFIILFSCISGEGEDPNTIPLEHSKYKLTLLWETAPQLPTVESVIYDPLSQHIYTANIDGSPSEKDSKGSISKLTVDGKIVNANWVDGLHAPTGLGIYNGKLYTTDIDKIIEVDMDSAVITQTYTIPGAQMLNDLTIGPDGTIYCSDTEGNTIYALDKGAVTKFVLNIESPNGLLATEDDFSVVCWNQKTFYQVNPTDKSLKVVTNRIRGLDGLDAVGNGDYLVSSYYGKVYYVTKEGEKTIILDTTKEEISATDIDYIPELQMLLVPTMDANKVMAYKFEEVNAVE